MTVVSWGMPIEIYFKDNKYYYFLIKFANILVVIYSVDVVIVNEILSGTSLRNTY